MTILIVDDIQVIRGGLISSIHRGYPDAVCLEAENGARGLEQAQAQDVDVVITDIKMPICDGLEMIRQLRAADFDKPIIILSGFGEFEYAKQALQMGVIGYLLKPIEDEALYTVLEKALQTLKKDGTISRVRAENQMLSAQNRQNSMVGRVQTALFLDGDATDVSEFKGCSFCLAAITIDRDFHNTAPFRGDEVALVRYAVRNIIEYLEWEQTFCVVEHPKAERQILLLFYAKESQGLQQSVHIAVQQLKYELDHTVSIPASVGVSDVRPVLDAVLHRHAMDALAKKLAYQRDGVYLYHAGDGALPTISAQDLGLIDLYIKMQDLENFQLLLAAALRKYVAQSSMLAVVDTVTPFIIQSLIVHCGCRVFSLAEAFKSAVAHADDLRDVDELAKVITDSVRDTFTAEGVSVKQEDNLARTVREFIDKHYRENISVKALAERFNINYSYLSSLFAKEVGMGIVAYCTQVRMENAKALLRESNSDIGEIAELLGYDDLQYFYRIFKKQTGTTPLAYRNTQKLSNKS